MKRQDKVSMCTGIILMLIVSALLVVWVVSDIGITSIGDTLIEEYGENIGPLYLIVVFIGVMVVYLWITDIISKIFSVETEDEEYFRLELKKLRKDRRKKNNREYNKINILKAKRKLELLENE